MPLEIGTVVEGKVTGITKFGAFVELPGGRTGMVHISEVSTSYVKEISDYVQPNEIVRVKILAVTPEGKINLSMKQAMDRPAPPPRPREQGPRGQAPRGASGRGQAPRAPQAPRKPYTPAPRHTGPGADVAFRRPSAEPQSFEEMMSRFKQTSDDKMSDIRRNIDGKRGAAPHNRGRGRA